MADAVDPSGTVRLNPSLATDSLSQDDRAGTPGRAPPKPRAYPSWLRPSPATIAVGAVVLLSLAALSITALGAADPQLRSDPGAGTSARFQPASTAVCNSPSYTSPSSLLITRTNPNGTLGSGSTLTATFEFAVYAHTVSTTGMSATLPSVFATFPLSSGSEQIYFPGSTVAIPSSGWTNAASMNKTVTLSSSITFKAASSATLTSEKLAIMAPTNYTTLTLEFRWMWLYHAAGGGTASSGWSTPTKNDSKPSQLRSIFYPAPTVSLLSFSPSPVTIGTNWTGTLGANVAGRYFLLEMEYPGSGKVVQAQGQTAPAGATTFPVYIPVLGYDHSLSPGSYLVHIHDACGAMLYNKQIQAVFAKSATVTFSVSPTSCSLKFNGTSWSNGQVATVAPSTTPYSMSVGCSGHTFKSWSGGGAVHVENGNSLLVSGNGTFSVVYS
jgi:hypothetical protein